MIDAISNMPGEIKTCFGDPESIKYGLKDQTFLGQPIINKEEEILIVFQIKARTNKNNKSMGF